MNEVSLKDKIDELRNINEKLSLALESSENRINKAIKYIENNAWLSALKQFNCLESEEVKYIVDMLKGKVQ